MYKSCKNKPEKSHWIQEIDTTVNKQIGRNANTSKTGQMRRRGDNLYQKKGRASNSCRQLTFKPV